MKHRWSAAFAAVALLTLGVSARALAAPSQGAGAVTGPNLVLTNTDGICSTGEPCSTYTLNSGEEIQVDLTADHGYYWTDPPSSTDSSVVALESESSDANGDATALFKVVGPGTAQLTAGATACPDHPPSGTACPALDQPWQVGIVGKLATAMAMSASPSSPVYGQPVTLVATIPTSPGANPVPTGDVDFYDGTSLIGHASLQDMDPNGDQAGMTISTLSGGEHELSAVYVGDQIFSGSDTIPVLLTVNPAPTRTSATPAVARLESSETYGFSLSATLTRSDTEAPVAGQQIQFRAGSTRLCTATTDAKGVATCNGLASAPTVLSNQGYTASFGGSPDYKASSTQAALIS